MSYQLQNFGIFRNAVAHVSAATGTKSELLPVLKNIMIGFDKEKITLTATDLELTAQTTIAGENGYTGTILVHGKHLLDVLKVLDGKENPIWFDVTPDGLKINEAKAEFTLATVDPDDFPALEPEETASSVTVGAAGLLQLLSQVSYAMSKNHAQYALQCLLLLVKDSRLMAAATDGHRLAKAELTILKGIDTPQAVIPPRTIKELMRVLPDADHVEIAFSPKKAMFTIYLAATTDTSVTMSTRLVESIFPDPFSVIPHNDNHVTVKREDLLNALRKVSVLVETGIPLKMRVSTNTLSLRVESTLGTAESTVEAESKEEGTFLFQLPYLTQPLTRLTGDMVTLQLPPEGVFSPLLMEEGSCSHLIAPIR